MSRKIRPGTKVVVNKNIHRLEELHERIDKLPPKPERPDYSIYENRDEYIAAYTVYSELVRPYRREYIQYASKGETGVVIEEFAIKKYHQGVIRYYKVQINGKIKTFRQGSIDVVK